jgi:hypothetical protein
MFRTGGKKLPDFELARKDPGTRNPGLENRPEAATTLSRKK